MRVTMMLCDGAQAVGGKLYILGGGWTQVLIPDFPTSMSLAVKLAVPWHEANDPHRIIAKLMSADGEAVSLPNPENPDEPFVIRQEIVVETGRPPGLAPGTEIEAPFVVNFPNLPLPAGAYVWELEVNGTVESREPFRVGPVERRNNQ
jgi:hypothetical protein